MHTHSFLKVLALSSLGVCAVAQADSAHEKHWGYASSAGPEHWGALRSEYALCSSGKEQSPINIVNATKAFKRGLDFDYRLSAATVVNNGHTVQVTPVDAGSIKVLSVDYALVQMHFHSPSEEQINGVAFPMDAHFVHRSPTGELAVVAVLFREGAHNAALQPILEAMPLQVGGTNTLDAQSFSDLLPIARGYFSYNGSLTTPPCSEGVRWQVLTQPVELSNAQLQLFKALYPMNARPVQPLNGRTVQVDG